MTGKHIIIFFLFKDVVHTDAMLMNCVFKCDCKKGPVRVWSRAFQICKAKSLVLFGEKCSHMFAIHIHFSIKVNMSDLCIEVNGSDLCRKVV